MDHLITLFISVEKQDFRAPDFETHLFLFKQSTNSHENEKATRKMGMVSKLGNPKSPEKIENVSMKTLDFVGH